MRKRTITIFYSLLTLNLVITSGIVQLTRNSSTLIPRETPKDREFGFPEESEIYTPSPLATMDFVDSIFPLDYSLGEVIDFENIQDLDPDYATLEQDHGVNHGRFQQLFCFEAVDTWAARIHLVIDVNPGPSIPGYLYPPDTLDVSIGSDANFIFNNFLGTISTPGVYWFDAKEFMPGVARGVDFYVAIIDPTNPQGWDPSTYISSMYLCLDVLNIAPTIQCNPPPQIVRNAPHNLPWSISDVFGNTSGAYYDVHYWPELPPGYFWPENSVYETGTWNTAFLPHTIDLTCISTHWISQRDYYVMEDGSHFPLGLWHFLLRVSDGYESTQFMFDIQVVPQPPLMWEDPADGQWVLFGKDETNLNINYYTDGYDRVDLFLKNNLVYSSTATGEVAATIDLNALYGPLQLDGVVSAQLRGYIEGAMIKEATRTFTFGKILDETLDLIDQNMTTIGEQLYFILHDPNGDNSFSSFSQSSKMSMGVNLELTGESSDKWEIGFAPELEGISPSATFSWTTSECSEAGFDFAYDATDVTSLSSNKITDDPNFIGPGYGDVYVGEGWVLNWKLTQVITRYVNQTIAYSKPLLQYGIQRIATLICSDINAPDEWRSENPVHNGYQNVLWTGTNLGPFGEWGGVEFTAEHTVTQTATITRSVSVEISKEAEAKVELSGFSIGRTCTTSIQTKNTWTNGFENEFTVGYTIYDDEGDDFIAMERGIDLNFGTYIFRTVPLCQTSEPLEFETVDHEAPTYPGMPSCTPATVHSTDSPQVIAQISDEGGIQVARVMYSSDGGISWDYQLLAEQPGNPGNWVGNILPFVRGTNILWYVKAWDFTGNSSIKMNEYNDYFSYNVQNTAPTIQLLSPVGGAIYRTTCPITWDASDVDADPLTFDLLYNIANTGWHYVVQGITGNHYDWDVSTMPFDVNYAVKIIAKDSQGGISETETDVTFEVDDLPTISQPSDLSYIENDGESHYLSWFITDAHAVSATYRILLDGVQKRVGTWGSGTTEVTISIGGFSEGIYQFTIEVNEEGVAVTDEVYLWVLKQAEVNTPLDTVGGVDLQGSTSYEDVPVSDTGIILQNISTASTSPSVVTAGLWDTNPTGGIAPFDDMDATYFAIDATNPENIIFNDPTHPLVIVVPLPLSFDTASDSLVIMTWDESSGQWKSTGFSYTLNELDWTASITIEHFSLFVLAIYDPANLTIYDLGILEVSVANSPASAWMNLGKKQVILNKLADVKMSVANGDYASAYDKLLHDIKPKLTSLKVDEYGIAWGSGIMNNPWVVDMYFRGTFASSINPLLQALRVLAGGDPNPVGRLFATALTEIDGAQADITSIDCTFLHVILKWIVGGARTNLVKAWDLYGADQPDWAAVRVKVSDCLLGLSDAIVNIGDYFGIIDGTTAANLEAHFAAAHAALEPILGILDAMS